MGFWANTFLASISPSTMWGWMSTSSPASLQSLSKVRILFWDSLRYLHTKDKEVSEREVTAALNSTGKSLATWHLQKEQAPDISGTNRDLIRGWDMPQSWWEFLLV